MIGHLNIAQAGNHVFKTHKREGEIFPLPRLIIDKDDYDLYIAKIYRVEHTHRLIPQPANQRPQTQAQALMEECDADMVGADE